MGLDALLNGSFDTALLFVFDRLDVELLVTVLPLLRNPRDPSSPIVYLDLGSLTLRHGALCKRLLLTKGVLPYGAPGGQTILQGLCGCVSHRTGLDGVVKMQTLG